MEKKKPISRTRVKKNEATNRNDVQKDAIVKSRISSGEDPALKSITDLVAYKIYQSADDRGPEANFITAENFVARYVSEQFTSIKSFDSRIKELGNDARALGSIADDIYNHYRERRAN